MGPVTADKINALCKAAKVEVEPIWPSLFAKCLGDKDIGSLISPSDPPPRLEPLRPLLVELNPPPLKKRRSQNPNQRRNQTTTWASLYSINYLFLMWFLVI